MTDICYMCNALHSIANGQLPNFSLNCTKTSQAFADISGLTQTTKHSGFEAMLFYQFLTSNWHFFKESSFKIEQEIFGACYTINRCTRFKQSHVYHFFPRPLILT